MNLRAIFSGPVRCASLAPRLARGVTLIELLVVIAVLAILAGVAAPSFSGLIASGHVARGANSFVADMRYARGEAMRRGKTVSVCRSAAPSITPPLCSTGDGSAVGGWMQGWFVFSDEDGDGLFEAGDQVLRVQEALPGLSGFFAVTTAGTPMNNRNRVMYDPTGRAVGYDGRWLLRPAGGAAGDATLRRTLCLNSVGRVRVLKGEVACN